MIKLVRGECPSELSGDVIQALTELYKQNKEAEVWNSPKIKKPLKIALSEMTNYKCAYCECKLGIESKDITIDHFQAKSTFQELVITWENLFPCCLRCNRAKGTKSQEIINPCEVDPKLHLAVKGSSFRLKPLNQSEVGKNTIDVLNLNDIDRVIVARMKIIEKIIECLEMLYEDIEDSNHITNKYVRRFERYLSQALKDNAYSAVASAKIINDSTFQLIKGSFIDKGVWNDDLDRIERELIKRK